MSDCRHKHTTYKIYRLMADDYFENRLLYIKRCKKCNRLVIVTEFFNDKDNKIRKKYGGQVAHEKYAQLKKQIVGVYKTPSLKFLDIGWVYLDGRAGAMKKLHNGAVVSREINGPTPKPDLIDIIDEHNKYLTQKNIP